MTTTTATTTTPTTTPLAIFLPPERVTLTTSLDGQALRVQHQGRTLTKSTDPLELELVGSAHSVIVEIHDFDDERGHWTVDASHADERWERSEGRCSFEWSETDGDIEILVTATSEQHDVKTRPFFIKVQPEGSKPDR
jgi:hypothetical protein